MSKFHINKHGVPAPCRAKTGNCPLGGLDSHYDTQEEAQAAVDLINEGEHGILPEVKHRKGVSDANVPDFYHEHDDIDDRFYDYIQETGAANFDHASFEYLGRQEQYDVWADGLSKDDYVDAFNDSYTEKDFDYLSDKIADHLVNEGVYSNTNQFDRRVERVGKEQAFKDFNNYLFNGTAIEEDRSLNDLVMSNNEYTQDMIDNLPQEALGEMEGLVEDVEAEYYLSSDSHSTANIDFMYDSNDEYSGEFHPPELEVSNYFRNVIEARQGGTDNTGNYYSWVEEAKNDGMANDKEYMGRAIALDKHYNEERAIIDNMAKDVKYFDWKYTGMDNQQQGEVAALKVIKESLF